MVGNIKKSFVEKLVLFPVVKDVLQLAMVCQILAEAQLHCCTVYAQLLVVHSGS